MRLYSGITTALLLFIFGAISAQDILMQGWYWEYPKSPTTGTNWAVTLENKANQMADDGFTHIWLPPLSRASFGGYSNGYDVKDLFDIGEHGLSATGFGNRSEIDALIATLHARGVDAVADVIYNHRDGGQWENNPAVEGWIENFSYIQAAESNSPYPSDRYRVVLPIGGSTGNGAGDYYFKISSASQHPNFHGSAYEVFMYTNRVNNAGLPFENETEPNGGGDCGFEPFDDITLGRLMKANIDLAGCTVDEFHLVLSTSDFFNAGDTVFIELRNTFGYSDHRIYGCWNAVAGMDIQNQIKIQTATDFTRLASGRGAMNWSNFKPNGAPTTLAGDLDYMWFFYDYDNYNPATRDTLTEFTKWLWEDVGVRGLRMDAVKHFPNDFLGGLLTNMHNSGYNPSLVVGEFFDYNPFVLNNWATDVANNMSSSAQSTIQVRAFDFALRGALKSACDGFGYDVRNLYNSGMVDGGSGSGFNAVTFVNNHDFRDPGTSVQNDPILAYAYILTNNRIGLPSVYYPDYYGVSRPNAPTVNLRNDISALIDVQQSFIAGSAVIDYLNKFGSIYSASYSSGTANTSLIYQMGNNPSSTSTVMAINFSGSDLNVTHSINTGIGVTPGDTLWSVSGADADDFLIVNGSSEVSISLPARAYGAYVNCERTKKPSNPTNISWCPTEPLPILSVDDLGYDYTWYISETATGVIGTGNTYAPAFATTYWVQASGPCGTTERVPVVLTSDLTACNCSTPESSSELVTGPNNVTISWDVITDAVGYQINGRVIGASTWKNLNRPSNINSINVLVPTTTYEWRVRAFCGGADFSDWTAIRSFTTPALREAFLELKKESNWSAFPNPASETVLISGYLYNANEQFNATLELVDITGRVVEVRIINSSTISERINLSELGPGLYQLIIRNGLESTSKSLEVIK
jgi:hypothetical protein